MAAPCRLVEGYALAVPVLRPKRPPRQLLWETDRRQCSVPLHFVRQAAWAGGRGRSVERAEAVSAAQPPVRLGAPFRHQPLHRASLEGPLHSIAGGSVGIAPGVGSQQETWLPCFAASPPPPPAQTTPGTGASLHPPALERKQRCAVFSRGAAPRRLALRRPPSQALWVVEPCTDERGGGRAGRRAMPPAERA